jgi:hypothetical protein
MNFKWITLGMIFGLLFMLVLVLGEGILSTDIHTGLLVAEWVSYGIGFTVGFIKKE